MKTFFIHFVFCLVVYFFGSSACLAQEAPNKAFIDGNGPGWKTLGEADFENGNCDADTWTWKDGVAHCTGKPIGVFRSKDLFTNFELVVEWRHLQHAGNSGVFVWTSKEALDSLEPGKLPGWNKTPGGVEIQMLDHGYAENYEKKNGKKSDWFTTHGDVFPVGGTKMELFPPLSASGSRSFPSKNLSNGAESWNHYYVRCINGEVRLWVNGEEVSGGTNTTPSTGHLCLESEGAPLEFRKIRVRVLP